MGLLSFFGKLWIRGPLGWVFSKQWQLAREFSECEYSPKRPFSEICETRQTRDIRRAVLRVLARLANIRQTVLRGLARLADIRQAVLCGLARLAKGEFGECGEC